MGVRDWAGSKVYDRQRLVLYGIGPEGKRCGTCGFEERVLGPDQDLMATRDMATRDYCLYHGGIRIRPSWRACANWTPKQEADHG